MYMLFAYQQIDTGNRQDNGEQQNRRRGGLGGISAAVAVKHIINISYTGVHFRRV